MTVFEGASLIWLFGIPVFIIPGVELGDDIQERAAIILAWPLYLLVLIARGLWSIANRP